MPTRYVPLGPIFAGEGSRAFLGLRITDDEAAPCALVWAPEDVAREPELVEALRRETARAVELSHPNILRVYGLTQLDGGLARVVEFADGESLRRVLDVVQRLPPGIAARMISDAAFGVQYAHVAGNDDGSPLIHGDLRPDTLFVSYTGVTKVSGYGALSVAPREIGGKRVPGRRRYSAPEQILGGRYAVTPQTDVYLLGAMLYEALTGEIPFHNEKDFDWAVIVKQEPALLQSEFIPVDLRPVISKALAKKSQFRYPTVQALREAIEQAVGTLPERSEVAELLERTFAGDDARAARGRELEQGLQEWRPRRGLTPQAAEGAPPAPVSELEPAPAPGADAAPAESAEQAAPEPEAEAAFAGPASAAAAAAAAVAPAVAAPAEELHAAAPETPAEEPRATATEAPAVEPAPAAAAAAAAAPPRPAPIRLEEEVAAEAPPAAASPAARPTSASAARPRPATSLLVGGPKVRRRGPSPWVIAAPIVAAAVGVAFWSGRRSAHEQPPAPAVAQAPAPAEAAPASAEPRTSAPPRRSASGALDPKAEAAENARMAARALVSEEEQETPPEPEPEQPRAAPARPTLEVVTTPQLQVFIDGRRVGRTPVKVPVSVGAHRVTLADPAQGIQVVRSVHAKPGSNRLALRLGKGTMTVTAPPGCDVRIDGRHAGTTPLASPLTIFEGNHRIQVNQGSAKWQQAFSVSDGQELTADVKFEARAAAADE
jgi:serine/threonine-protein kinase